MHIYMPAVFHIIFRLHTCNLSSFSKEMQVPHKFANITECVDFCVLFFF